MNTETYRRLNIALLVFIASILGGILFTVLGYRHLGMGYNIAGAIAALALIRYDRLQTDSENVTPEVNA